MVKAKGFLFDITRCSMCGACWVADKERNGLPVPSGDFLADKLSDKSFLVIKNLFGRGVRFSCMHCVSPTCVSVCPVAALEKTPIGAVIYHKDRCIGCRYCVVACPFDIPKYEWSKPLPYVRKCDFCYSRIINGQMPACAAVCPTGALLYGDRDELLQEARRRLNADPSKYVDHIYGEREVGGTSLLILSDIPMEKLGYPPSLSENPVPPYLGGPGRNSQRRSFGRRSAWRTMVAHEETRRRHSRGAFGNDGGAGQEFREREGRTMKKRFKLWWIIPGLFFCLASYSMIVRFIHGLGASTHLSDQFPWGLWVGLTLCAALPRPPALSR